MSEQPKQATPNFAEALAGVALETIILKAPSGLFYERVKPTVVATLFDLGEMPQSAASAAQVEWAKHGVGSVPEPSAAESEASEGGEDAGIKKALEIRDRVCSNSISPKITMQQPAPEGEFHWSSLPPKDLEYLYHYEMARGDASAMLAMFPERPSESPIFGSHSKKHRTTPKRIGGA